MELAMRTLEDIIGDKPAPWCLRCGAWCEPVDDVCWRCGCPEVYDDGALHAARCRAMARISASRMRVGSPDLGYLAVAATD